MKNIHVLPTENESRLRYNSFNKVYELCEFPKYHTDIKSTHNIYITSDERIERGDWVFDAENEEHIYRASDVDLSNIRSLKSWYCKKIILTTDVDLIKYGVQAIDDEFLEWFVKNPSCEEVETLKVWWSDNTYSYDIIVPKEEPFKHELHVMSKEEVIANRSNAYEFIGFDKQETLEYGLLQHIKLCLECKNESQAIRLIEKYGFEQQERMYSYEEVLEQLNLLYSMKNSLVDTFTDENDYITMKWFEQFKKK